jgi:DNA-binding transcriptional LysR family regulator
MRSLPLKALQTFEAVARYNNFHQAAKELYVTPSAVSHQIKNLEGWLECPLFVRRGNQLEILPQGQELASSLSLSLGDIRAACQRVKQAKQLNTLVIAAIPSVATCWLIPRLSQFQLRHPQITLRVTYALHGSDIDFSDVDIAFIFAHSQPTIKRANVERFRSGQSYPVCSAEFLKLHPHLDNTQIAQYPLLHDANTPENWKDWFKKAEVKIEHLTQGTSFDDFNLLRSAALAGQGVALCPVAMIEDDLASKRLVQLSDISVSQECGYYLLSSQESETSPNSQLFRDWVFEQ